MWTHILAFDLLAGRWTYLDSRARGMNAWLMVPVLLLSLYAGPLGFVLYLIVRALTPSALPLSALDAPDVGKAEDAFP